MKAQTLSKPCHRRRNSTHQSGSSSSPHPHIAAEPTPSAPHISAEPTQPAAPFDFPGTTTDISNTALTLTLREAGQNVAPTDATADIQSPCKASQVASTHSPSNPIESHSTEHYR